MEFRRRLAALIITKDSSCTHTRARAHPTVAVLHDSTNALLGWTEAPAPASCTWVGDGVDRLGRVLEGLVDLPHPSPVIVSPWTERLLNDLLTLADAHKCFGEVLQSLKQLLAEAHAGLRHRDAARLAAVVHARRGSDRIFSRLASILRAISRSSYSSTEPTSDFGEAALAEAVAAATCAVASASAIIFARIASSSTSSTLRTLTSLTASSLAKGMEQLRSLEECVVVTEDGCEQVYRALVNARMSLLNMLSADYSTSTDLSLYTSPI